MPKDKDGHVVTTIRMPADLYQRLVDLAVREQRSVTKQVIRIVEEATKERADGEPA